MSGLRNVLSVARYERILLMRTMRFRVLGGIGVFIPVFVGVVIGIAEASGAETGAAFGVGAVAPFYIYSFLQTVVIAFLAGDFRAADERAHTHEVISVRPLSTTEIVVGKYLGVVEALVGLSLVVMLVTMAVQGAKLSLLGTPFRLTPYLGYFLLLTLPALVYMAALTFFLGGMLRNRTAAALLAIGYVIAVVSFLGQRYGGIFDFGAFFAPIFYSDMVGFVDLGRPVQIRLLYLALAIFLLGLAAERYPRLPQPGAWRLAGRAAAVAGLVAAVALFARVQRQDAATQARREALLAQQVAYAGVAAPQVLHYDLAVDLMADGAPLAARAGLRLANPHEGPLDRLVFTLNPGLEIVALRDAAGHPLAWERRGSVVEVPVSGSLASGAELELVMEYAGEVDRDGFDLVRTAPRLRKDDDGPQRGDLNAWILPSSVYLPPRSRWYPSPGVDYGHEEPPLPSFFTAEISVSTPAGLTVLTQGTPIATLAGDTTATAPDRPGEPRPGASAAPSTLPAARAGATGPTSGGGEGAGAGGSRRTTSLWTIDRPVPQLSLNAGEYEVFEARVGDVDLALYVYPEHRRPVDFFADAGAEVLEAIEQLLGAMERETGLPYPYSRLSLIEVPFLVQWYYEGWREVGGLTQPGVLMVEEDLLTAQRFERDFRRRQQRSRAEMDPGRLKRDLLVQEIFRTFLSTESRRYGLFRSPIVQLWSYDRGFVGDNASLLGRGMPVYLQEDVASEVRSLIFEQGRGRRGRGRFVMRGRDGGGGMDVVAAAAEGTRRPVGGGASWEDMVDAMQRQAFVDMDPGEDPELYRAILDARGLTLFRMMRAAVGADVFVEMVHEFGEGSRFAGVSLADFERAAAAEERPEETALDAGGMQRLVREWLTSAHVPGYTLTRASARKVDSGWGAVEHEVTVRIRNGEPGLGFVQVVVSGFNDEVAKGVQIEGGQEVEVVLSMVDRPFRVSVEPFFAKNRRPLVAPLRVPEEVEPGPARSSVRQVTEEETPWIEVVVDDEDEGFSMPIRRVQRYLRPGLEGGNWYASQSPFAYGSYNPGYRWKRAGDGAQPAVWTATLPRDGEYDVGFYFLPTANDRRRNQLWGLASDFELTVLHAGGSDAVRLDTSDLVGGWNLLGRFRFGAGQEATVELTDRADGRVFADAVRWRYIDPDHPEWVYQEGFNPWQDAGAGRRGRGPGGGNRIRRQR